MSLVDCGQRDATGHSDFKSQYDFFDRVDARQCSLPLACVQTLFMVTWTISRDEANRLRRGLKHMKKDEHEHCDVRERRSHDDGCFCHS